MTLEEFIRKYQINLTKQQLEGVTSIEMPTLLLAVPGSGKTTVLVYRLGYMIYCKNIMPEKILTLTYTVAATIEMRRRFAGIFGEEMASRLEFRTINGVCAKIIHYCGVRLGIKPYNLIPDEGFKVKLLTAIYQHIQGSYPLESDVQNLITLITYAKNMMLSKKEIEKLGNQEKIKLLEIYEMYNRELSRKSLMDYDDQMVYALNLLKSIPEILEYFQEKYQFISVDEAQDTSKVQHEIIRILGGKYKNIFMVGDEDQSIYGFRAAYPEALLEFGKTYPNGKILLMEENFRSNGEIVVAADRFIQKNTLRHKKKMKAFRPNNNKIRLIDIKTRKGQYNYLEKVVTDCENETAVLYRDNESILPVIDLLEQNNIPYKIKNKDLTFFTNKVVMDIENIINFSKDQTNTEMFMQIYFKINTYVGKVVAEKACVISKEKNISLLDAVLQCPQTPKGTVKSVKEIKLHMKNLANENGASGLFRIINAMGYKDYLEKNHIKDGKLEIVQTIAQNQRSVFDFVARLKELEQLIRNKENDASCNLIFSTMHSSKGLEFDNVYIMDAIDGVFPEYIPGKKATDEEIKIYEEERRLFYVAVTRAKNNLCIFSKKGSNTFICELLGTKAPTAPIGKGESTPIVTKTERKRTNNIGKTKPYAYNNSKKGYKTSSKIITESEYWDKYEEIKNTGKIEHKTLGEGVVKRISGDTIEVEFENRTSKMKLKFLMEKDLLR